MLYVASMPLPGPPKKESFTRSGGMLVLVFRKTREKFDIKGMRCRKKRRSIRSSSPTKMDSSGRSTTFCNEKENFPSRDFRTSWGYCCMGHLGQVRPKMMMMMMTTVVVVVVVVVASASNILIGAALLLFLPPLSISLSLSLSLFLLLHTHSQAKRL